MSQYDKIETAADMIREIQMRGLSTIQDDLNRVADIFGNAPIEDLIFLANDIGRNNEKGEPDPKGTFSSTRRGTRNHFYSTLSQIWNWEDVTRFWNRYSNPERDELVELRKQTNAQKTANDHLTKKCNELNADVSTLSQRVWEETQKAEKAQADLEKARREIIELKAKLYDQMMAIA